MVSTAAVAGVISSSLTIYLPICRSESDFERFPASERVESSNSEDDSASEADTESDDEIQMGGLDDEDAAAVHQTDPNLPIFYQAYGPQGSCTFTNISLYQLVENLIL